MPPTKRWKERPRTPSDLFRTIARTQRNPSEEGTTMHTAGHRPQNYVSRCFLRCRPPAPTETIGFPVRQQSGTKRCRKPQETIPTHPPESDDTKIRPFPRSDYKKTQVQRCTTRHPTRFWFKVGKSTGRSGNSTPSSGRRVSESRLIRPVRVSKNG